MSRNSATLFSVEDDGSLSKTPIPSQQKCLVCNGPVSNHHVRNLTRDLEDSIPLSRSNKSTAPAAPWINNLTDTFKDAIMDHDVNEMMLLNTHYLKMADEAPDLTLYTLVNTAKQTIAPYNQIQTPVQTPPPLPSPHAV